MNFSGNRHDQFGQRDPPPQFNMDENTGGYPYQPQHFEHHQQAVDLADYPMASPYMFPQPMFAPPYVVPPSYYQYPIPHFQPMPQFADQQMVQHMPPPVFQPMLPYNQALIDNRDERAMDQKQPSCDVYNAQLQNAVKSDVEQNSFSNGDKKPRKTDLKALSKTLKRMDITLENKPAVVQQSGSRGGPQQAASWRRNHDDQPSDSAQKVDVSRPALHSSFRGSSSNSARGGQQRNEWTNSKYKTHPHNDFNENKKYESGKSISRVAPKSDASKSGEDTHILKLSDLSLRKDKDVSGAPTFEQDFKAPRMPTHLANPNWQ